MIGNRLLSMPWCIVAVAYALRNVVAPAAGQNLPGEVEPMLLAPVLMKLNDMDGDE